LDISVLPFFVNTIFATWYVSGLFNSENSLNPGPVKEKIYNSIDRNNELIKHQFKEE
jgi:hypothetical protein